MLIEYHFSSNIKIKDARAFLRKEPSVKHTSKQIQDKVTTIIKKKNINDDLYSGDLRPGSSDDFSLNMRNCNKIKTDLL